MGSTSTVVFTRPCRLPGMLTTESYFRITQVKNVRTVKTVSGPFKGTFTNAVRQRLGEQWTVVHRVVKTGSRTNNGR